MTDNIDNGGPAFPHKRQYRDSQGIDHEIPESGMTLRDWFAGQALAAVVKIGLSDKGRKGPLSQYAADISYRVADAMIAARKGGGK